MGANSHERIVDLWRPGPTRQVKTGRRIRRPWPSEGYTDEVEWKTGRRRRITPEEAWRDVADQEGYEDGHSYSGTFGSKHGMVVLARNDKVDRYLGELGSLMDWFGPEGEPIFDDPLKVPAGRHSPESRVAYRKKINARKKLIELLGEATLRRIAAVYDDKWGPAAAVVGKDQVWFGGMCSS